MSVESLQTSCLISPQLFVVMWLNISHITQLHIRLEPESVNQPNEAEETCGTREVKQVED